MIKLVLTLAIMLFAPAVRADEIVQLLDGTKLAGKVVHYYDGVLTFSVGGQDSKIPKDKIRSITFELPKARPEYATPEKTFERWRQALVRGDLPTVVDCYQLMAQGLVAQQMSEGNEDDFRKMRDEIKDTKFQVKSTQQKGESATLKVVRQKGDDIETAELRFVRENGEWKMTPPM
ncbi:MAG: hypothetical protein AABZ30_09065 [Myxococcota bacterium]